MGQGFIDTQPLEFRDFSGGLSENFLQGDTKRYAAADNFLISVDRKLLTRDGTVLYDPSGYTLPSNTGRVGSLFLAINETILLAHANRDIYTQTPDSSYGNLWAAIKGPTGNEALTGGSSYSQVTTGEFQRQVYFTSDASIQPGKLFRDISSAWVALTAGLPKMSWYPNYPDDSSILAKCITLANALRAGFIDHFNDSYNGAPLTTSTVNQHKQIDKWSLSYFEAQSWSFLDPEDPGPVPTPTPAPVATDLASLKTLCVALALAYEHHRNDLAGAVPALDFGTKNYHQDTIDQTSSLTGLFGLAARLVRSGSVTTVQKAAAFLDELKQKWYWHQLIPLAHSPNNDYTLMAKHLISAPAIGTIYSNTTTVQVAPNYDDFIAFAQWIKQAHNYHVGNLTGTQLHTQGDSTFTLINLPDASDFDSAALTIFWARYLYGQIHVYDSNIGVHTNITFDTTLGSVNLTNVKLTTGGAATTLTPGDWLTDGLTPAWVGGAKVVQVISSGLGTAVVSKVALASSTHAGQTSTSYWHVFRAGNVFTDATVSGMTAAELLATGAGAIGTDLTTWVDLGTEYLYTLGAHEANGATHLQTNVLANDLQGYNGVNSNPFFIPTVATYTWAAFYRYRYTVEPNGLIYLNQGTPIFSDSLEVCASMPAGTVITSPNAAYFLDVVIVQENPSVTITGIPALANTSLTNYDTTTSVVPQPETGTGADHNLTIELYRTTDGGTTFFYLESIVNGQTTYDDVTNESLPKPGEDALNLRKVIYTAGGVVGNDQPPMAKFVHQLGGFMYYGAITDTGQFFPQRIRQSIQGAPDSAPGASFDDLEDELTALSSTRNNLIALCKASVYRVQGSFNSLGQGAMTHERISQEQGCLNAKSVIQTEIGLFFAGSDGFYYTDGYQLIKLSIDLDRTYRALTESDEQKARIYGAYDKKTRRIWWAMQSNPTASDNDVFFVHYLDYGTKPFGVFTKALTTDSWMPSSCVFYKGRLIIGDSRGYLFKSDNYTKTDPKVNTEISPTLWHTVYIPWNWTSCSLDFGTTFKRKYVTRIHCIGQNVGDAAIQINSINDMGTNPDGSDSLKALPPVQYLRNFVWGDPTFVWGDSTFRWKYDGKMDVWRRFPSGTLRSDFKQIQYVPGDFVVYKSDKYPDDCTANVSSGALTATIATPSGYTLITWPGDVLNYFISFDTDSYDTGYLITALDATKTIITFSDPDGTIASNTAAKWQITGIKKEQRIKITSVDVHFGLLGDENEAYPGASGDGGEGANA